MGSEVKSIVPRLLDLIDEEDRRQLAATANHNPTIGTAGWESRRAAMWALGQIGDTSPRVIATLRRNALPEDDSMLIQNSMADAYSQDTAFEALLLLLPRDAAIVLPDLLEALDHQAIRIRAALAISRLTGDRREAVQPLVEALASTDVYFQTAAVLALAEIGPDANVAVPALRGLLLVRRNSIPNQSRPRAARWTSAETGLDGLSVSEAARRALTAIDGR